MSEEFILATDPWVSQSENYIRITVIQSSAVAIYLIMDQIYYYDRFVSYLCQNNRLNIQCV